jgi:hypothetical protein
VTDVETTETLRLFSRWHLSPCSPAAAKPASGDGMSAARELIAVTRATGQIKQMLLTHDACLRLARAAGGHCAPEGADRRWKMPRYTITDSFDADFGVDQWMPTVAVMALLTGLLGQGPMDLLCSGRGHGSPLSRMATMERVPLAALAEPDLRPAAARAAPRWALARLTRWFKDPANQSGRGPIEC